jgi:polyisoprenoid-binding protein YceI
MKTSNYLYAIFFLVLGFSVSGQNSSINVTKSTIKWTGKKLLGQHEGLINVKNGFLKLENNKIVGGDFTIDMNSLSCTDLEDASYNKKLVGHLKSDDFFGVAKFPEASFKITSATEFNKNKASISGKLTIKGKTQPITFEIEKNKNSFSCKMDIDRSKFDVRYGSTSFFDSLGDKAIYDIFTLNINLLTN